jgi:hypothetical protein
LPSPGAAICWLSLFGPCFRDATGSTDRENRADHRCSHLEDIYTPGISRTIYDPTCGTGGMLSVSEEYIREHNDKAHLSLFGQEYNPEAYAICCSDLLIKDEPLDNIVFGDTLGDGKTSDGQAGTTFHYMLANPPFGVEWKTQQKYVEREHVAFGFGGRFGPGLPRINDGALLFLMNMIAKPFSLICGFACATAIQGTMSIQVSAIAARSFSPNETGMIGTKVISQCWSPG